MLNEQYECEYRQNQTKQGDSSPAATHTLHFGSNWLIVSNVVIQNKHGTYKEKQHERKNVQTSL